MGCSLFQVAMERHIFLILWGKTARVAVNTMFGRSLMRVRWTSQLSLVQIFRGEVKLEANLVVAFLDQDQIVLGRVMKTHRMKNRSPANASRSPQVATPFMGSA